MNVQIKPKQSSLAVKIERNDHTTLTHRNDPDQHTIKAITDLSETLADLYSLIKGLQDKVDLHDESSTEVIEGITQKLTELIAETVTKEKERAEKEEQDIREDIEGVNTKLEKLDVDFNAKIANLDAHDSALKAEILYLGNEVSKRVDEHQRDRSDLATKIANEATRAEAAEQEIRETAQAECSRAQKEEEKLASLINDETLRAQKQEDTLQKIIGFVEVTSKERDIQLEKTINEEIARSTSYDDYLNITLFTEIKRSTEIDNKLDININNEIARAKEEEARIENKLDNEIKRAIETDTSIDSKLDAIVTRAAEADAALQQALDEHIVAVDLRSDVVDIVGTKVELDNYNKESLTENDIIKVLADEDYSDATTYYRLVENEFIFVGKVGPYYTETEINNQTEYLRDGDVNFAGTKSFGHITSNQVPQVDEDLTNKIYVDTSVITEKERATDAEKVLTDSIDELSNELTIKLETKADLVDGKIPNSQLPESHKATSIFEYESIESFPETGLEGSLYISVSDNVIYR